MADPYQPKTLGENKKVFSIYRSEVSVGWIFYFLNDFLFSKCVMMYIQQHVKINEGNITEI